MNTTTRASLMVSLRHHVTNQPSIGCLATPMVADWGAPDNGAPLEGPGA